MSGTSKERLLRELEDKDYRDGYVEGHVRGGIPHQIKAMRDTRGWSQGDLARRTGKPQSVVARLENPEYGKFTISTLLEMASAFDVALLVRFIPFDKLLGFVEDLSPNALNARSFDKDDLVSKDSSPSKGWTYVPPETPPCVVQVMSWRDGDGAIVVNPHLLETRTYAKSGYLTHENKALTQ